MTSEVQRWRMPRDVLVNQDHQKSTKVQKFTEPQWKSTADLSLSWWRSFKLHKRGWPCQNNASCRWAKSPPGGSILKHTEKLTEKSTEKWSSHVLLTSQKPTGMQSAENCTERSTEDSTEKSNKIWLKPPIKRNYEVNQMITKTDFERRLLNNDESTRQCGVRRIPGCKMYSTEYAEALEEGSRERRYSRTSYV